MSSMTSPTVIFITGAGRGKCILDSAFRSLHPASHATLTQELTGIGKSLTQSYLQRPNHIVIASVRDSSFSSYEELKKSPAAEGSRLILVSLDASKLEDLAKAIQEVAKAGIAHIDIVLAVAGISPAPGPLDIATMPEIVDALNVNTVSPRKLYQASRPLLEKSKKPIWIL
jgi:NAD(P)-dependent dehydrogenase (short-subunit alcohol dehydrogenase family)